MSERWRRYYGAAGDEPRDTLLDALARHEAERRPPGIAVDLGCGAGRDTLELLRRGWRVVAVDAEPRSFELLAAQPDTEAAGDRLQTVLARFDEARWPEADIVNASFSLPFCAPSGFARTWARIVASLRPGGRFCGHLFGVRDGWAPADDMTFHERADVDELVRGLEIERLDEVERDGQTACGEAKHWHVYSLVVRMP